MSPFKPVSLVVAALITGAAHAQATDAQALLRQCEDLRIQRSEGVQNYVVDQSTMGNRVSVAYERIEAPGPDGKLVSTFRQSRGAGPTAGRFGVPELSQAMGDARPADATVEDLASAARDVGLTENEIAACRNPS